MSLTKKLIVASLVFAASNVNASQPLRTVPQVDINRYAGTWHEQARLPMFFQRKCVSDVTANYTLKPDGNITVDNRCKTTDGKAIGSIGVAKPVAGSTSKLKVRFAPDALSFLPFTWADYWVVELDPDYRWVLVGEPKRKYMWILSREPRLAETELQSIIASAKQNGFDTSRLIFSNGDASAAADD